MGSLLAHIAQAEAGKGLLNVFLDALLDSLTVVPVLLLVHILMAAIDKYAGKKTRGLLKGPLSPLIGTAVGVLPQCGFSVAATKMYTQKYIPLGALISVYIATSDEAVAILLRSPQSAKKLLPLLIIKIIYALVAGYLINLIMYLTQKRREKRLMQKGGSVKIECLAGDDYNLFTHKKNVHEVPPIELAVETVLQNSNTASTANLTESQKEEDLCGCGCGEKKHKHNHDHKGTDKKESGWHTFLIHPLVHTLKIFVYIFIVSLALGYIIYLVTPEVFESFMTNIGLFQPVLAGLVGLIPNCAASVLIAEMYAEGLLGLGAAVSGLSIGAGLGYAVLIKEKKKRLSSLLIILGMFAAGSALGVLVDVIVRLL